MATNYPVNPRVRAYGKARIAFEQPPQPCQPGSSLHISNFRTPHGICVELWGVVKAVIAPDVELNASGLIQKVSQTGKDGGTDDGENGEEENGDEFDDSEVEGEEQEEIDVLEGELGGNSDGNGFDQDDDEKDEDLDASDDEDLYEDEDLFYEDEDDDDEDEIDQYEDKAGIGSTSLSRSSSSTPIASEPSKSKRQALQDDKQLAPTPKYVDFDAI